MNRCPISYQECEGLYSPDGLKMLSGQLSTIQPLPFTVEELRREAAFRATKMSIQGIQPKLSARLSIINNSFEIVDTRGTFILKPQTVEYRELPQNEDLTMKMAKAAGIETPVHGLIYNKDQHLTYFIKRFDRKGKQKIAVEDFAQLAGHNRNSKYSYTMEKLAKIIEEHCTFPVLEKIKLFRLTLFCYLTGNDDMHLKNFSLITREGKVGMTPAYDLLNTTIVLNTAEEFALSLKGKKSKLTKDILVKYYGQERLGLNSKVISEILLELEGSFGQWEYLIERCFLSPDLKQAYSDLVSLRKKVLF